MEDERSSPCLNDAGRKKKDALRRCCKKNNPSRKCLPHGVASKMDDLQDDLLRGSSRLAGPAILIETAAICTLNAFCPALRTAAAGVGYGMPRSSIKSYLAEVRYRESTK